jgi:IS30 family transposase
LLARPPYVCNGCDKKAACRQDKQYYRAKLSDDDYRVTLVSARQGINMSKEELNSLDELVSPLILKGQPISHIAASLSGKLPVCERTIYNYVDCGILTAGAMDLPRKVSYKPRKKHKATFDRSFRDGRGYRQFKDYMAEHPDAHIWEMDTVIGSSGSGKALLTMMLRGMGLMLIFLLPSKTQESVKAVFAHLKSSLGSTLFSSIFTAFLTDNGTEFFAWDSYLVDDDGVILSEIFFCDPNAAYQKGRIEKNHEYIRLIIPKGKSFAKLTDDSVRIIMNHINSTARPSLGGRTPQELGLMLLPKELFTACGLELIDPSKVTLKPALLKTL